MSENEAIRITAAVPGSTLPREAQIIRELVRSYYDIQRIRVAYNNRLKRMVRDGLVLEEALAETHYGLELRRLSDAEDSLAKRFAAYLKEQPIWEDWLSRVRGIGPVLAAGIIAEIGHPSRFETVSKLWAFAGLAVRNGVACRRTRGEKANWSPGFKVLCWKLAHSFVLQGGAYRKEYERFKAHELELHPQTPDIKPGGKFSLAHLDLRAQRKVVKLFLSHLWQRWRELEGLPTRPPYAIEYLKHTSLSDPARFATKPAKAARKKATAPRRKRLKAG